MNLVISEDAAALGIHHPVAAKLTGVVLGPSFTEMVNEGHCVVARIAADCAAHLGRPEVQGFRSLFESMGYPGVEPAGERLVRTFVEKGFKPVNSAVDAYNIAALEAAAGVGMHDIGGLAGDIVVRRARDGETIVPIFKDKVKAVPAGDLVYANDERLLAWLGRRDVDSNDFRVTPATTGMLLIVLGNAETGEAWNTAIVERCVQLLRPSSPHLACAMLPVRRA